MHCGSLIRIWNLASHMKKKKRQNAISIDENMKTKSLMFFVSSFHVICKISDLNIWTSKLLVLSWLYIVEWWWKAFRFYAHSARVTIFFRILVACASLLACVCLHFLIFICSFWLILYGQAESGSVRVLQQAHSSSQPLGKIFSYYRTS